MLVLQGEQTPQHDSQVQACDSTKSIQNWNCTLAGERQAGSCKQGQLNKHKSVKQFNSPDTRLNMRSIGMGKVKLRLASIFNARNPSVDDMSVDKYIHNDCKN
jgi:hypothetical protein